MNNLYYTDSDCSIFNGRSEEVLPQLQTESIDLTVTSPPYDELRKYNGFYWDFKTIARQLYRITKPGGVVVWIVGDQTVDGSELLTSAKQKIFFREDCGFNIHDTMIWEKPTPQHPMKGVPRYIQAHEYMFILSKGKPKTFNPIEDVKNKWAGSKQKVYSSSNGKANTGAEFTVKESRRRGTVWEYRTGWMHSSIDEEAYEHPAIFPERLALDHIKSWSNAGDIVLDPFAGSGTTAKAAKLLKRKSIAIDCSQEYCDLMIRRLNPPIPLFEDQLQCERKPEAANGI